MLLGDWYRPGLVLLFRVIADEVVEPMENILKTITQVNSATCLRYIPTQLPTLYTCLRYISTLLPTLRAYACARPCPIPDMLAAWLCVIPCSVWCYHAHAKSGTDAAYDATVFPVLPQRMVLPFWYEVQY